MSARTQVLINADARLRQPGRVIHDILDRITFYILTFLIELVIVDTTTAPAVYVVGQL